MNYVYQDFIDNPELLDNLDKIVKLRCNHCNKEYDKERKYVRSDIKNDGVRTNCCSRACASANRVVSTVGQCVQCNKDVKRTPGELKKSSGRFYCSQSCAASYNNTRRDPSLYVGISIKLKENTDFIEYLRTKNIKKSTKVRDAYTLNPKKCIYCEEVISFKRRDRIICSNNACDAQMRSIKGRKGVAARSMRSKDEITLHELCSRLVNECLPNHIIADGWDADIVLPEHKIAILWNGPWHYKEMNIGNHSLKQVQNRDRIKTELFEKLGWKVMVFEDRYYTPQTAFETIKIFLEL